ncbi:hypothetical protein C5706_32765, partial [Klebsiella pneumoniae]
MQGDFLTFRRNYSTLLSINLSFERFWFCSSLFNERDNRIVRDVQFAVLQGDFLTFRRNYSTLLSINLSFERFWFCSSLF